MSGVYILEKKGWRICLILRKHCLSLKTIIYIGNPLCVPMANCDDSDIITAEVLASEHQLLSNNTKLVWGTQPKQLTDCLSTTDTTKPVAVYRSSS